MKTLRLFSLLAVGFGTGVSSFAQVLVGLGTYTESFDGMGSGPTPTYPAGWSAIKQDGTSLTLITGTGSSNGGGAYNFGSTSAADRALGSVASATTIPTFGVVLRNNAGLTLSATDVAVSFRAEQWRTGSLSSVNETWTFEWKTGSAIALNDPSGWLALSALNLNEILTANTDNTSVDGNASGNFQSVSVSSFSGLTWAQNDLLILRWRDTDNTGSDAGMALDNFVLTAIPEPSTYALLVGLGTLGIVAWRRKKLRAA